MPACPAHPHRACASQVDHLRHNPASVIAASSVVSCGGGGRGRVCALDGRGAVRRRVCRCSRRWTRCSPTVSCCRSERSSCPLQSSSSRCTCCCTSRRQSRSPASSSRRRCSPHPCCRRPSASHRWYDAPCVVHGGRVHRPPPIPLLLPSTSLSRHHHHHLPVILHHDHHHRDHRDRDHGPPLLLPPPHSVAAHVSRGGCAAGRRAVREDARRAVCARCRSQARGLRCGAGTNPDGDQGVRPCRCVMRVCVRLLTYACPVTPCWYARGVCVCVCTATSLSLMVRAVCAPPGRSADEGIAPAAAEIRS
jgi:hypothetical protein